MKSGFISSAISHNLIFSSIHATVADPYLSDLLGIMENAPLLYITTVAYNQNDIPFEYSLASYRADMYKMNVDLYKDKYYK